MISTQLQEIPFICSGHPSCATWNVEGWFDGGKFNPVDSHDIECVDCDAIGKPIDRDMEVA